MIELLLVVGLSLAVSFLCSILEAVLLSLDRSSIALMRSRGERAGHLIHKMKKQIDEPIAAILTLNTIAHTFGASLGGVIAARTFGGGAAVGIFASVLTLAVLVLTEIIPKTIGATYSQALARPTAHILRLMIIVMKPVLIPLGLMSRKIASHSKGRATVSRAEIAVLAELGHREGTLDEGEFRVMSNVMHLDDLALSEVMTPRIDIIGIPAEASVQEATNVMLDHGKLRLPVYRGDLDEIVGILLARDLWRAARDGVGEVRSVMRPVQFAPDSKAVEELIREMRANRTKMVVVVDEYGGTAGLVTLEDLIEEIIGEIKDEHETDEPREFQDAGDGTVLIWGGTPVKDVEARMEVQLGEEFDTIGGYVFGALEGVGRSGDTVTVAGGRFVIERMSRRRVEYVRFHAEPAAEAAAG